jgi:hypothetical protein
MKYVLLALALMTGSASAADTLVGRWKLTDYTMKWADTGEVTHPRGQNALGYLEYSPGGRMSVIISSADLKATDAFAGTYKVQGNKYVAHVEISTAPDLVGKDVGRTFEIRGDRLTVTTDVSQTSITNQRPGSVTSTWQRIE